MTRYYKLDNDDVRLVSQLIGQEFDRQRADAEARGEADSWRDSRDAIRLGGLQRALEDWLLGRDQEF